MTRGAYSPQPLILEKFRKITKSVGFKHVDKIENFQTSILDPAPNGYLISYIYLYLLMPSGVRAPAHFAMSDPRTLVINLYFVEDHPIKYKVTFRPIRTFLNITRRRKINHRTFYICTFKQL